jgi:hypothetical protein
MSRDATKRYARSTYWRPGISHKKERISGIAYRIIQVVRRMIMAIVVLWVLTAGIVLAAPFLVFLFLVPEIPRWLAKKGLNDATWAVLAQVSLA